MSSINLVGVHLVGGDRSDVQVDVERVLGVALNELEHGGELGRGADGGDELAQLGVLVRVGDVHESGEAAQCRPLQLVVLLVLLLDGVVLHLLRARGAQRLDQTVQALQQRVRTERGEAHEHQIGEHLDVVVVEEAVLDVVEELEYVDAVEARVEQRVHALEGRLAQVQAVVHRVLERAHFDLTDQLFANLYRISRRDSLKLSKIKTLGGV